jgi:hypothetical protein
LLAQEVENVTRLGDMREVDLGFDLIAFGAAGARSLAGGLRFTGLVEMSPHLVGFVVLERTGMSLLLRDTEISEHIQDCLALDFQFSGQIVDSNLAHPPFLPPQFVPLKSSCQPHVSIRAGAQPKPCAREV